MIMRAGKRGSLSTTTCFARRRFIQVLRFVRAVLRYTIAVRLHMGYLFFETIDRQTWDRGMAICERQLQEEASHIFPRMLEGEEHSTA